jgi:hypothetical protein
MMSPEDLDTLIEKAAERGADNALRKVGLHDDQAGKDIQEVRSLLESWRDTKKTVQQTIAKMITTALLTLLAIGTWHYWGTPK